MIKPGPRTAALVSILAIVLAACGQHAGVHAAGQSIGYVSGPNAAGPNAQSSGGPNPISTGGPGVTQPGQPITGPSQPGSVGGGVQGPQDTTGVTKTQIILGLHAPATGAAPIRPDSFAAGTSLYWNYLDQVKHQKIYGRSVKVYFEDDGYKPTQAVAVCDQMASQDHSFLLIGGAGTDQIYACANYAAQRGIPYLSPGVQQTGLSGLNNYFAVTETYSGQMPQLVQMLKAKDKKCGGCMDRYGPNGGSPDKVIKVMLVRPNTPGFDDEQTSLQNAVKAAGWQLIVQPVQKEGSTTDAQTVATNARTQGVDILVVITAPVFTTTLANQFDSENYRPQWTGVAITNNINQVLQNIQSCNAHQSNSTVQGALYFSPWPSWKAVMEGQYDPDFKKAADRFAPKLNTTTNGGDLLLALWGISKGLAALFQKVGPNLSRQAFIKTASSFSYSSGAFPNLSYTPGNPFGGHGVFLLDANCNDAGDPGAGVAAGAQWVPDKDFPGLTQSF